MKRLFDVVIAIAFLLVTSPLSVIATIGICLTSPGPILYRAKRVGRGRLPFTMFKFRTMHWSEDGAVIAARQDARIFPLGGWLRRFKIDEIPQFVNVLIGDMSVVGPRPEDPAIVETAYSPWMLETLDVRPGITGPGAVYYYSFGERLIDEDRPVESYVRRILPAKLALERAYIERTSLFGDVACMIRTAAAIVGLAIGHPVRPSKRDLRAALRWVPQSAFADLR